MSHGIRFGVSGHAPHPGFEYSEVAAYCMEEALAIDHSGGPIWVHGPEPAQEDEFFDVLATLARISRVEFVNVHAGPADEEVECTNDACRFIWSRTMMPACPRCGRGADDWCDFPSSSLSGICEALCEAQRQLSQFGKRLCVENGHESPALMARIFERLCVFRLKSATDSDAIRPPIPIQIGHPFRSKPATDSGAIRPPLAG